MERVVCAGVHALNGEETERLRQRVPLPFRQARRQSAALPSQQAAYERILHFHRL